jgi:hypothetical protein
LNDQLDEFLTVISALNAHDVKYILVGGVALIFHGMERLTLDVDIFIQPSSENIVRLRQALHSVFEDPSIEEITVQELQAYPVIRYGTPNDFYIDIMTRLGEAATYDDLEYEIIEHQGISIRIATPETLYDLKKDTVRQKDRLDAAFLQQFLNENS